VPFTDPSGEFEISVPESWLAVSTRGDLTGMGARLLPDDTARAGMLDAFLAGLPRPIVFTALDAGDLGRSFVVNMNVVSVPRQPWIEDLSDLERAAPVEVEAMTDGTQRGDPERVDLPAGEAVRIEYEMDGAAFAQYHVLAESTVWTMSMNADDFAAYEPTFDAIAATFALTDGSSAGGGRIVSPDGTLSIVLADPWVAAFRGAGDRTLGTQLAPDDPRAAADLDDGMWALTSELTQLVVADGDKVDDGFEGLVFDGITGLDPSVLAFDTIVEMSKPPGEDAVGEEGRFPGSTGEVAWFESSTGLVVTYVVVSDSTVWNIAYWAEDVDARRAEVDQMVASFTPF
jgi:hypothetical protein